MKFRVTSCTYAALPAVGFDPNTPAILTSPAPIFFEENVAKDTGTSGRTDVYRAGHFAWEYKAKGRDLDRAYSQLQSYAADLNNPPLLIVSDFDAFRIYPQWPNIDHRPWIFHNADLLREDIRDLIRAAITDPDRLLIPLADSGHPRRSEKFQAGGRRTLSGHEWRARPRLYAAGRLFQRRPVRRDHRRRRDRHHRK